jgi:cyanophycinase
MASRDRRLVFSLAGLLALAVALAGAQTPVPPAAETEYGPARGALVIVGGGSLDGTGILERFIELAGGPQKHFVIVPTAGGNRRGNGDLVEYDESAVVAPWIKRGIKNARMLHTHDPKVADTEEFVKVLREADAVWFNGGRQWNIVDSYAGTLTYREFHKLLERGGVIGGSSAGATIQGEYLVRGDTSGPNVMMTEEPNHQKGFEFLRQTAIDQHINARNRWDDLIPVIQKMPHLLGLGISEGTAIVVTGDRFEVVGKWMVAVHDNARLYQPWEKPYFVLAPGDAYDMKARRIVKLGTGVIPSPPRRRGGMQLLTVETRFVPGGSRAWESPSAGRAPGV